MTPWFDQTRLKVVFFASASPATCLTDSCARGWTVKMVGPKRQYKCASISRACYRVPSPFPVVSSITIA